jgi:hypothetical protein
VVDGKVHLRSTMSGSDVSARTEGIIGLDGGLDLPIALVLSRRLSDRLAGRVSFAKYLTNRAGKTEIHIRLSGSVERPRPVLDTSVLREKAVQELKEKASEGPKKLLGTGRDTGAERPKAKDRTTPQSIIRDMFGR